MNFIAKKITLISSVFKFLLTFSKHFGIIHIEKVETQDGCHDTS